MNAVEARPHTDGTRIYVLGTLDDTLDVLEGLRTRGGVDGFVLALTLVR